MSLLDRLKESKTVKNGAVLAMLGLGMIGCKDNGTGPEPPTDPDPVKPQIQSLTAPEYFDIGEAEKIVWEGTDADNTTTWYLAINGDRQEVNAHDSTTYTAQQDQSIEVTLIGDDKDFSEDVTRTINAQTRADVKPEILQFDVPERFDAGYAKKIIWNAQDQDNTTTYYLEINGDRRQVNAHDNTTYTPQTPGNAEIKLIADDKDFEQDVTQTKNATVRSLGELVLDIYNVNSNGTGEQRAPANNITIKVNHPDYGTVLDTLVDRQLRQNLPQGTLTFSANGQDYVQDLATIKHEGQWKVQQNNSHVPLENTSAGAQAKVYLAHLFNFDNLSDQGGHFEEGGAGGAENMWAERLSNAQNASDSTKVLIGYWTDNPHNVVYGYDGDFQMVLVDTSVTNSRGTTHWNQEDYDSFDHMYDLAREFTDRSIIRHSNHITKKIVDTKLNPRDIQIPTNQMYYGDGPFTNEAVRIEDNGDLVHPSPADADLLYSRLTVVLLDGSQTQADNYSNLGLLGQDTQGYLKEGYSPISLSKEGQYIVPVHGMFPIGTQLDFWYEQ